MSGEITVSMTVDGQFGKAPIGPFSSEYKLSGQTGGLGPQQVTVPSGAGPSSVAASLAPLSVQSLLFICTDNQVTYEINGDGIQRTIKAGGVGMHPGDPVITALAFGGNGSTDADVTVIQLGVAGAPPSGVGGAFFTDPEQTAGASQPSFALTQVPAQPSRVLVFVDGVLASPVTDYSVAGSTVTWTGAAFAGGERINFVF